MAAMRRLCCAATLKLQCTSRDEQILVDGGRAWDVRWDAGASSVEGQDPGPLSVLSCFAHVARFPSLVGSTDGHARQRRFAMGSFIPSAVFDSPECRESLFVPDVARSALPRTSSRPVPESCVIVSVRMFKH
eukprot:3233282-Prymnesium_polylepis.2